MLAFQQGDSSAFESLYGRHKDRLLRFLLGLGGSPGGTRERAEELAQDSWASVIKNVENYRVESKFSTYLFTVARNRWIDETRKLKVRTDVDGTLPTPTPSGSLDEYDAEVADIAVEGKLDIAVDYQRMLQAVEQLPQDQRVVFLLKEAGFSLKDISQQLNLPSETVKSRLRYARNRLRERFIQPSKPWRAVYER